VPRRRSRGAPWRREADVPPAELKPETLEAGSPRGLPCDEAVRQGRRIAEMACIGRAMSRGVWVGHRGRSLAGPVRSVRADADVPTGRTGAVGRAMPRVGPANKAARSAYRRVTRS
jgi:hypothetical protein